MKICLLALEETEESTDNLETEETIEEEVERPVIGELNVDKVIEESQEINQQKELEDKENG